MVQLLHDTSLDRVYTWGLDLSGSVQGAGGIGGRLALDTTVSTKCSGRWPAGIARSSRQGLAAQDLRSGTKNYWFLYDANGNVGQVLDATNLSAITTAAKYEYDPYGNTLSATGTYAASNPFRFSTKWFDTETGLSYYGYRYYSERLGRWMSRDPMGEEGGANLYSCIENAPTNATDYRGLWTVDRKGEPRAIVTSEGIWRHDGIEQLARVVNLDPDAYRLWLKSVPGSLPVPDAISWRPVPRGCRYSVPNVAYVHKGDVKVAWPGWKQKALGGDNAPEIEGAVREWNRMADHFRSLGYYVTQMEDVTKLLVLTHLRHPDVAVWAISTHGVAGTLAMADDDTLFADEVQPHHRLAEVVLFACQSRRDQRWWNLISRTGRIHWTSFDIRFLNLPWVHWESLEVYVGGPVRPIE